MIAARRGATGHEASVFASERTSRVLLGRIRDWRAAAAERRDGGHAHDRELPGEVLDGMGTELGRRGGTPQTRRVGRPQRRMDALRGTKRALFRPFTPPAPPTKGFSVSRDYA